MTTWVGERELWSQCVYIEISSLLLWPIDPLSSNTLLYLYDNKLILIMILIFNIKIMAHIILMLEGRMWQ